MQEILFIFEKSAQFSFSNYFEYMKPVELPIYEIIPQVKEALKKEATLIVQAPPGAGKSTVIPLELLKTGLNSNKKIILLEPRRLAAKTVAGRMAKSLNEPVGKQVGYRVKLESCCSPETKIEVVTEGVLLRMLQDDPELTDVGIVIFDEFHERSLQTDLSLALALDIQQAFREELKLLIMSATLDGEELSTKLSAPIISSQGFCYPLAIAHCLPWDNEAPTDTVVRAVITALRDKEGSILVFLPGVGEITKVQAILEEKVAPSVHINPLYGALSLQEQERAIRPAPEGERKVVLATDIAETSLTIEGITLVVDSGLVRKPQFDPGSGLSRLKTSKAAMASIEQRAGRAGRIAPGSVYRAWDPRSDSSRAKQQSPEIVNADLSSLLLELALWGVSNPLELFWIDTPPEKAVRQAGILLQHLGALTKEHRITNRGKAMARLGLHPRLAAIVIRAKEIEATQTGCCLAALLSERAITSPKDSFVQANILHELDLLFHFLKKERYPTAGYHIHKNSLTRVAKQAKQLLKKMGYTPHVNCIVEPEIAVLAGFADRIAERKSEVSYLLANGKRVELDEYDALKGEHYLIVLDAGGAGSTQKIFRALPITKEQLHFSCDELIEKTTETFWDKETQSVKTVTVEKLGAITLSQQPDCLNSQEATPIILEEIRKNMLSQLPWCKETRALQQRLIFLSLQSNEWPDFSDEALSDRLEMWLTPFLLDATKASQFQNIDLKSALLSHFDWDQQTTIDSLAPTHVTVPEGSRIAIDYGEPKQPVLAVKLQMMFGSTETPTILNGSVPLLIHLLSPAGRPLQITKDLKSFWENSYEQVKKEMKGRYPKHPWPDNPMEAVATRKTKRALGI